MKRLYLIRHAEAEDPRIASSDFSRSLTNQGLKEALLLEKKFNKHNFNPDLVFCSPAKRALSTAVTIFKESSITYVKSIYESTLPDLIKLINTFSNKQEKIVIIGHNPSISALSDYLTDDHFCYIPTCGIIKIELEIDSWSETIKGIGTKKALID